MLKAASNKEIINAEDFYQRFTLDAFCDIAFGINVDSQASDVPFSRNFDLNTGSINLRFITPVWKWMPWLRSERDVRSSKRIIDDFAMTLIESRKASKESIADQHDLLSFLVREDNEAHDDTYVRDQIINFIIAGRDTSAQLLTWVSYYLAREASDSRIWRRLAAEAAQCVRGVAGTYDEVKSMPYTEAVLKEALRLMPPVAIDTKVAVRNDVWPDGTVVRAGDFVNWHTYALGRDNEFFPNALEFKPERWLDIEENGGKSIPAKCFVVFNAGPRLCLGQRQAMIETAIVLSMLVKAGVRFELAPQQRAKQRLTHFATTLRCNNGMQLVVKKINE